MILSMTGYGKSEAVFEGKKIHVEIKSLNSKSLDLSTRIAPLYREKEIEIRKMVAAALERGKVDMNVWVEKRCRAVLQLMKRLYRIMFSRFVRLVRIAALVNRRIIGGKSWCACRRPYFPHRLKPWMKQNGKS